MDSGYYIIIGLFLMGVAYGFFRKKPPEEKKSKLGWAGLFVLGALMGGLVIAGNAGSENWTWFFGLSLMVVTPIMLFFAIGSSVGSFLKPVKDNRGKASKKKADTAAMVCIALALVLFAVFPWVSACLALAGIIFWVKSRKKDSASTEVEI
jgi:MFS family permease